MGNAGLQQRCQASCFPLATSLMGAQQRQQHAPGIREQQHCRVLLLLAQQRSDHAHKRSSGQGAHQQVQLAPMLQQQCLGSCGVMQQFRPLRIDQTGRDSHGLQFPEAQQRLQLAQASV